MWRNSATGFGRISRLLHWLTAGLILCQLPLGFYTARAEPGLANLWLFGAHKTLGLAALALVAVRLVWHRMSPPPPPLGPAAAPENRLARATHRGLYALMLVLPLAGWVASSASGLDILFLNRWVVPPLAPVSPALEEAGFALHRLLAWALAGLVALHVAGALRRALGGDGTLRRMLRGA
jgi:cytochrome b561